MRVCRFWDRISSTSELANIYEKFFFLLFLVLFSFHAFVFMLLAEGKGTAEPFPVSHRQKRHGGESLKNNCVFFLYKSQSR
jgi:hypothetical protein